MIELKNVTKSFKRDFYSTRFKALDEVSFKINAGDLVGFLGANGAGKTTSLKIILNFIKADSGEISYSREIGGNHKGFLKNLGYLPERPYFHASLSGHEFVEYMALLHDVERASLRRSKILYWSERLNIAHALDRKLFNYSKGMLQRIGFVASLVHDPQFLILDEPVSGLDPIGRREIKDVMLELHKAGKTIFFSSHIVSDVEEICHNVIVLDKGKLIYNGSVEEILERDCSGLCEAIYIGDELNDTNLQKYENLGNGKKRLIFLKNEKSSIIEKIMKSRYELVSLRNENPSLEEIIYKGSVNR